jgi:hypothetical protein
MSKLVFIRLVAAICMILSVPSRAQTAPSTAPAPAADQSTPRGALRVLAEAMDNGDAAGIRSAMTATTPLEKQMVDALIGYHEALAHFSKAAEEAFGADEAKKIIGDKAAAHENAMAALAATPEKIDGDTAIVGDGPQHVQLVKVDGKWTIPAGKLAEGTDTASVNQRIADLKTRARIYNEVTEETKHDQYKTPEEAWAAVNAKAMKAASGADQGAASQPATQPTSRHGTVE